MLLLAACAPEFGGTRQVAPGDDQLHPDTSSDGDAGDLSSSDAAFNIRDGGGFEDPEAACGDAGAGTREERAAFVAISVTSPATCTSETQVRTCDDGSWSPWSGTFSSLVCTVVYRSCGDLAHGASESRVRYPVAVVDDYQACAPETQTRTCNDGTVSGWTGTASQTGCEVALYGICGKDVPCHEGQCASSHSCTDDAQCVDTCVNGKCAAKADAGETCDGTNDCNLFACLSSPGSATCTDLLCQCPSGNYCTSNDQCVGTCAGSSCRAINTVCDTGDAADCTGAFSCVSKRCVLPEGSACTVNSVCQNACRAQKCSALGTYGQVCDETADCGTGLACSKNVGAGGTRTCLFEAGTTCNTASSCASNTCSCTGGGCTKRCGA